MDHLEAVVLPVNRVAAITDLTFEGRVSGICDAVGAEERVRGRGSKAMRA